MPELLGSTIMLALGGQETYVISAPWVSYGTGKSSESFRLCLFEFADGGRDGVLGSEPAAFGVPSACLCLSSFETKCLLKTFAFSSSGRPSRSKCMGVSTPLAGVSVCRPLIPAILRWCGSTESAGPIIGEPSRDEIALPLGGMFGGGVPTYCARNARRSGVPIGVGYEIETFSTTLLATKRGLLMLTGFEGEDIVEVKGR